MPREHHIPVGDTVASLPWYRGLDRTCWIVLVIAALGWCFDTMDQNLFNLVRAPSIKELLGPRANPADVKVVGGWVTAAFLIGWATGGFIFGAVGDRIGRTGTMVLTILLYAAFTGLSGLAWNWESYAVMRFMTGLGVGGEWAAGAAIVAEVFPDRSRAMALGMLQALGAIGNMAAAGITFVLAGLSWRWAYAVGAAPALLVFAIRRGVREPEKWTAAKARETAGEKMGSIRDLFLDPRYRRHTIAGLLMGIAGQGALWGVGFWSVDLLLSVLAPYHLADRDADRAKSVMFFVQQAGAMAGIYAFSAFCERTKRRTAFFVWFAIGWLVVPAFFWLVAGAGGASSSPILLHLSRLTFSTHLPAGAQQVINTAALLAFVLGFATLGPFAGYTIYFPELYPTRLRATGCGICYNGARFLTALLPPTLGGLSAHFARKPGAVAGGLPMAATLVACIYSLGLIGTWIAPETRGRGLPEENRI